MLDRQPSNTNTPLEYEDFTCPLCFRDISPDRPPIYNPDNCSCIEEASASGPHRDFEHPSYSPESYASSSLSALYSGGPENEKPSQPNIRVTNSYLPLGPDTGLNETEHRQSSSFKSDMPYQLQRFLIEQEEVDMAYSPPIPSPAQSLGQWLPQDVQIQSSRLAVKGSKKSKQSKRSMKSSGSSGMSYEGYGGDPMAGMGSWDEGSERSGQGYALELSGVSEFGYRE